VLRTVADIDRLTPGDILICEMTTPEWTMAFGKVSGIVTRVGGALCHAAIVAREFNLPCVVNCADAFSIADGQIVTLNVQDREARVHVRSAKPVRKIHKPFAVGDCPSCGVPRTGIIKHACPEWAVKYHVHDPDNPKCPVLCEVSDGQLA